MKKRIFPGLLAIFIILNSGPALAGGSNNDNLEELARFRLEEIEHFEEAGSLMLPIRHLGEGLGYKIEWNQELRQVDIFKGAVNTSIKPGFNAYFFGRRAPVKLKSPPILRESTSFVPEEFFTKILRLELQKKDGDLIFLQERPVYDKDLEISGYIKSLDRDRNDYSILLGSLDSNLDISEVIIHIVDDSRIEKNNKTIRAKDLRVGQKIDVKTPSFMTRGIPPETTAKEILVEDFLEIENKNIDMLNYPILIGVGDDGVKDKINSEIDSFIKSLEGESYDELDLDYIISFINQDLISIIFNGNFKNDGRDYSFSKILNFSLRNGEELNFNNFFKKDEESIKSVDEILKMRLKKDYNKEYSGEERNIYFTEEGLVVFYYESSNSISLPVEVQIDYSELVELVDK